MELEIRELAASGDGVGRAPDGRVVFVSFTAPGDRVQVRLERHAARHARGSVVRLLSPSPRRTDPVCPVFGSCGGCAWQHVDYAAQLDAKRGIVAAALQRIGGLAPGASLEVVPSPSPYRYRSRSRVRVSGGRVGYRRRRSHAVCAVDRCPLLVPELEDALAALAAAPPSGDGEWELAWGFDEALAAPRARAVALPAAGGERLWLPAAGRAVGFSPGVFAQSNAALLDDLARDVAEAAGRGALALDLYAGAGFLTLPLLGRFDEVVALEADERAARDLEANLRAAGVARPRVVAAPLEVALREGRLHGLEPDAVVLDPPRGGLAEGVAGALARMSPQRVVYLSCHPATLARDLSVLVHEGYTAPRLRAYDLFPQTPHVEVLAALSRRP